MAARLQVASCPQWCSWDSTSSCILPSHPNQPTNQPPSHPPLAALFSSGSLQGYLPYLEQSSRLLVQLLTRQAQSGSRVDIHHELGRMTLQAVGTCAFGVDFHCFPEMTGATNAR